MASSVNLMALLCLVSVASWAGSEPTCSPWSRIDSQALNRLSICEDVPVDRLVGQVCLRHEWRCGDEPFGQWLATWLSEMLEPVSMAVQGNQLVFSGQFGRDHLALFWTVRSEDTPGFRVLVSRIRPVIHQERQ